VADKILIVGKARILERKCLAAREDKRLEIRDGQASSSRDIVAVQAVGEIGNLLLLVLIDLVRKVVRSRHTA
jgi:hypothetical protein